MQDDVNTGAMDNKRKLKLLIWSISAGVIVAFFFGGNFLKFATGLSLSGEILFISPLFCGFILGILTTMDELHHSVFASIIMTISAVSLISLSLFSPLLFGVAGDFIGLYYVFVIQNISIAIVTIFPVALVSTIIGKVVGEYALLSHIFKRERAVLRSDTLKWYQMLEEAADDEDELKPIGWEAPVVPSEAQGQVPEADKPAVKEEDGQE